MPDPTENDDIMPPDELLPEPEPAKKRPLLTSPGVRTLRDELQAMVQADLLGPAGGEHEEIGDEAQNVRDRYILGVLAPPSGQGKRCMEISSLWAVQRRRNCFA